jgi:hypothetical protein
MANSLNVSNPRLFDQLNVEKQLPYIKNGLTALSNNNSVHPRDEAGNIILQENSDSNPLLIIEPTKINYSVRSVIRNIDTQFEYFKFPVTTVSLDTDIPELNVDIDTSYLLQDLTQELIIPITYDAKNQPQSLNRISTTFNSGWYYNAVGTTDPALIASGYRELPFTGGTQTRKNAYTIEQTQIDILNQENKTLKFTIQVQFTSQTSTDVQYKLLLQRGNTKSYRPKNVEFEIVTSWGTNQYPFIRFEYVLDLNDIVDGDRYTVSAVSNAGSWILSESCYWDIEPIDRPAITGVIEVNDNDGVTILQQ